MVVRWKFRGSPLQNLLPQLTQDAFLWCLRYADTPPETDAGFQMGPVVWRLELKAGGAGGLRRDFEFVTDLGFWILADVGRFKCRLTLLLS